MKSRTNACRGVSPGARLAAALTLLVVLLVTAIRCTSEPDLDQPYVATDPSSSADEADSAPTESSSSTTESPSSTSEGSAGTMPVGATVEPGQAVIVSTSNVEGETEQLASALVDDQAVDSFLAATDPRLAADVRAAVKDVQVPTGSTLFGSVVAVGCEEPVAVSWERTSDGISASAQVPKPTIQCLVPVTSVALFLVEDSA